MIPIPDKFRPSRSWVDRQVKDFSTVREKLDRYRAKLAQDKVQVKAHLPGKTNERGESILNDVFICILLNVIFKTISGLSD